MVAMVNIIRQSETASMRNERDEKVSRKLFVKML
jgi:hypothetical protein